MIDTALPTAHLNLKWSLADISNVHRCVNRRETATEIAHGMNQFRTSEYWVTPSDVQELCRRNGLLVPRLK